MRRPNSGCRSNQSSFRRSPTTSPTTMSAGGFRPGLPDAFAEVRQGPFDRDLVAARSPAHGGRRRLPITPPPPARRAAVSSKVVRPMKMTSVPVRYFAQSICSTSCPPDEAHLRCFPPVRQRNAGISGHSQRRGHAGNHLERHAGLDQRLGLLATPPEHEGSPPLRRTTMRPARASAISSSLISGCVRT